MKAIAKDLFGTTEMKTIELVMPNDKDFVTAWQNLNSLFTKDKIVEIYDNFRKRTADSVFHIIDRKGDHSGLNIMKGLTKKVKSKDDYLKFMAVVIAVPENFRKYLFCLPEGSLKVFAAAVKNRYVSVRKAKKISRLTITDSYYYSELGNLSKEFTWFTLTRFDYYYGSYDSDYYIYLHSNIYHYFVEAMMPEAYDAFSTYEDLADKENYHFSNFENNVFADVPLIGGMFTQGVVKPGSNKLITASAQKKLDQMQISNFKGISYASNMRTYMLSAYIALMGYKSFAGRTPVEILAADVIKKAPYDSGDWFDVCLPFYSGLKRTIKQRSNADSLIDYVNSILVLCNESGSSWLNIQLLFLHLYSNFDTCFYSAMAFLPDRNTMDNKPTNLYDDVTINPDDIMEEMTKPFIRAYLYLLASWGLIETAEAKKCEYKVSPLDALRYVRMTKLGRYAFGIDKSYEPPKVEGKKWFEVDNERLIFRSLEKDNPYTVILQDVSNAIGGGRYEVTPESFLAHCSSQKDVEKNIDVFKRYIGAKLPQVWKDFFNEMLRHCQPLEKLPVTNYKMYRVEKDNKTLQRLLTTDEKLRQLVIRAEGYIILVEKTNIIKFENRLKALGYLL